MQLAQDRLQVICLAVNKKNQRNIRPSSNAAHFERGNAERSEEAKRLKQSADSEAATRPP